MSKNIHDQTREIYHKQHNRLNSDQHARNRIHSMYTTEYFGLGEDYFKGKKCLDAGCGNMAVLAINLSKFGASEVHAVDLGTDWIPFAKNELAKDGISEDQCLLSSGSVLSLPFEDNSFDFVACNGVLVHLANIEEAKKGFEECARVCKPGGHLYITGGTVGGIVEGVIFPALREHYQKDETFKQFIDNIKPEDFFSLFQKISNDADRYTNAGFNFAMIAALFDEDYCVYLQNALQPPSRLHQTFDRELITALYDNNGFEDVKRLSRYVKRQNIRKYLAPLHYDKENIFSKILFGDGSMEFIGTKK